MYLPTGDDVLTAFAETWHRWVAYQRLAVYAGPTPDVESWFDLLDLELAVDRWADRFIAALARRGMTVFDVLGAAA